MSELVVHDSLGLRMEYAKALAASSLLPESYRGKPANVLVAVEYGRALGLEPMVAIQGINVINGKPSASAQLIASLVRRAGHRLRVVGTATEATASIVRADDPGYTFTATWNMARATAAGLAGKGGWKTYPEAMLKARAITEVARDACPEVLAGVAYTAEELGADEPSHMAATFGADTDTLTPGGPVEVAAAVTVRPLPSNYRKAKDEIEAAMGLPSTRALATEKQLAVIRGKARKVNLTDELAVLDVASYLIHRPLEALEDLTKDEASALIDASLEAWTDGRNAFITGHGGNPADYDTAILAEVEEQAAQPYMTPYSGGAA